MASKVPKKMIKIHFEGSFTVSLQTEFGLGGVISSAAICFPSHRSMFTVMYFIASFEYQVSFPSSMHTGSKRFAFMVAMVLSKFSAKSSLYE